MGNQLNMEGKSIGKNIIRLLSVTLFSLLFYIIFGEENLFLGICIGYAILMIKNTNLNFNIRDSLGAIVGIYIAIGAFSYISRINIFIGIIFNFVIVFLITYMFTNKLETKVYLPFLFSYVFLEGVPISFVIFSERMLGSLLGGIIIALIYYKNHKNEDDSSKLNLGEIFQSLDINTFQFNFAIRMGIMLTLSMFITNLFDFQGEKWINIIIISLTQPHYGNIKKIFLAFSVLAIGMIVFSTSGSFFYKFLWIIGTIILGIIVNKVIYNIALEKKLDKQNNDKIEEFHKDDM